MSLERESCDGAEEVENDAVGADVGALLGKPPASARLTFNSTPYWFSLASYSTSSPTLYGGGKFLAFATPSIPLSKTTAIFLKSFQTLPVSFTDAIFAVPVVVLMFCMWLVVGIVLDVGFAELWSFDMF